MPVLSRKLAAEFVGTALLLATVVGSGIMGEQLSGGNAALALLANALATGAILYALISAMANISGAHFNPVVTLAAAWTGKLPWRQVGPYVVIQIVAALAGVVIAHWMFELPTFFVSEHVRSGPSQAFSEMVASFGLITVVLNCARWKPEATPAAVATFITAAYWFTASTSFANPAVTLARSLTDTFSGIRPADAPAFIGAQFIGAAMATVLHRWMMAR
jgi:glycerol uptake facilitator-like aquaporin